MELIVDPAVLFAGRLAALSNATSLHSDADFLLQNGRYASSFFLANIATEELGKYALIVSASVGAAHGSLDWKKFWKNFRSHTGKTHSLLMLEDFHNLIRGTSVSMSNHEENKDYAHLQEEVKMKSLYCDYRSDVGFLAPAQIIRKDICKLANELLAGRLEMVTSFESQVASGYTAMDLRRLDKKKYMASLAPGKAPAAE
jgi:AbiV family abortive infection protein